LDPIALTTRHLLLPAYYRLTGSKVLRHYRRARARQFLPEEELRESQWRAAQDLLRYVHAHNPFHRARLTRLGAGPEDFRSLEDFRRLPLLTKEDLRDHAAELLSEGHDPRTLLRKRTGGSTGVPVHLHWDQAAVQAKRALTLRHDEWAGFRIAERQAALWGNVEPRTTPWRRLTGALYDRTVYLDTLAMDEHALFAFVDAIRHTRARHLFGHGHSLYWFARFLKERGIRDLALDGIISSSEMLPPAERRVVEEVFGEIVFDRYGCEEVGLLASECEAHDGLHVAADGVLVEILGGCEEVPGRVVVTDLLNRATPLLRYEIGDLATTKPGACRCGRGLPRIGMITGRTSDVLLTPDGGQVSGISLLDTVTIHIPGFRQVQVLQDRLDELCFHVVRDGAFSEASLRMLAEAVRRYFGAAMRHRVVFVDAVPLTGRGKYQFSVCRVKAPGAPR
jgi:phenylacetate-CoA ligase